MKKPRPKRPQEKDPNTALVQSWIPREDYDVLRRVCEREGRSMSNLLRRVLRGVAKRYAEIEARVR